MAIIRNREKNFRRYLEKNFEIQLPSDLQLFYAKGIRIGNRNLMRSTIHGELGYAACDFGFNPTNAFIQNFGHLAKKNVIELDEVRAKKFAAGYPVNIILDGKARHVIIRYDGHTVGLGHYEPSMKKITNGIPEKRRRQIINEI